MRNRDQNALTSDMTTACCTQCECEENPEQSVVFELIVPETAKMALPRLQPEVGALILRENSVTTTVPDKLYLELRASNTALHGAWCMTATLAASVSSRSANYR